MNQSDDEERRHRLWYAHGGQGGVPELLPHQVPVWRPGLPTHWQQRTPFMRNKSIVIRVSSLLQLAIGIVYLQYRVRHTIGIFESSRYPPLLAYQIFFFILECLSAFSVTFRIIEAWNVVQRCGISLKEIPNHLIAPYFLHSTRARIPPHCCNYPSVGIFIPCFNEDVDMLTETVVAALNLDYPSQLLTVYLCDDGKDPLKRMMISHLRKQYHNIHYVIRPEHKNAKAGNLNYALERTTTDLVVTLDADFIARPQLLQRLIPYYFVWNATIGMYEFNETLAVVQAPQHFRNLSPYDSDPLDQRGIYFFNLVLPGKDWFNASTMVGTTNLINRAALKEANYYPYHSITEDTALTIKLHGLGYRTYFVNESLATGLATTSLSANLRQRARWLKGDWQILFSRHGPLTQKGLSIIQRMLYLNMAFTRVISIVHMGYDIGAILLLTLGIAPLDTENPVQFIIYLACFVLMSIIFRYSITMGGGGLDKSESGNVAFEAIFRYMTLKGFFIALFQNDLKFKVTDKKHTNKKTKKLNGQEQRVSNVSAGNSGELFKANPRQTVLGRCAPDMEPMGMEIVSMDGGDGEHQDDVCEVVAERVTAPPAALVLNVSQLEDDYTNVGRQESQWSSSNSEESVEDEYGRTAVKKKVRPRTPEERRERRHDIHKNLKRTWFNSMMATALIFSIVWAIVRPPNVEGEGGLVEVDGVKGRYRYENTLALGLAIGFALSNLLPHILAFYLCFIPYVSGWVMSDVEDGRCDQWAVHPKSGKLFVPFSFISLLSLARVILILGAVAVVGASAIISQQATFVPLEMPSV